MIDWADAAGLVGVVFMLIAYAAVTGGWLDPKRPLALSANLSGAILVLASLSQHFNLSAMIMEIVWALVALAGLVKLLLGRRRA